MALLEVSNLGIAFGGLQAVAQLDLSIEKGHLYGLIGPNGAGKTTVFNMLTGVYKPTEGNIILDGKDITGQNPELISKSGIARTFQNIRLFNDMTVLDNVKVGLHNQIRYNMWTGILRLPAYKEKEHEMNRFDIFHCIHRMYSPFLNRRTVFLRKTFVFLRLCYSL